MTLHDNEDPEVNSTFKRVSTLTKKESKNWNKNYELQPCELLAKLFESFMLRKLGPIGVDYLPSILYTSPFYPLDEELDQLEEEMDVFFLSLSDYETRLFPHISRKIIT